MNKHMQQNVMAKREVGVLLHPSSLASPHGIGDFGVEAFQWVDWLASAGMAVWQILPLCPPSRTQCPYASWSALAGNCALIDLRQLKDHGLLSEADLHDIPFLPYGRGDLSAAVSAKHPLLRRAAETLLRQPNHALYQDLQNFRDNAAWWVEDTAIFSALKQLYDGVSWTQWPDKIRRRDPAAIRAAKKTLSSDVDIVMCTQFFFGLQWTRLRAYAHANGIRIIGDVPIYVNHDSVDVWANQSLFALDSLGNATAFTGAPPDYFSPHGQKWGGNVYRWEAMAQDNYLWWRNRFRRSLEQMDVIRIDHFRAFSAYWEISCADDARSGHWEPGPGEKFFQAIEKSLGALPLIAEDLGTIDGDVIRLRDKIGAPGMRVMHYGFDGDHRNLHLPHNYIPHSVAYAGTHDNDTTIGWWNNLPHKQRTHVQHYFGVDGFDIAWDITRAILSSASQLAVIQMQDILALPSWARMNDPSTQTKNVDWMWRLQPGELLEFHADRLRMLATMYGRVN